MKKSLHEYTIKEALEAYLHIDHKDEKLAEIEVLNVWEQFVSAETVRQTMKTYVKNGVLYLQIYSPALKNDLRMQSSVLISKINAKIGNEVLKEIVFL